MSCEAPVVTGPVLEHVLRPREVIVQFASSVIARSERRELTGCISQGGLNQSDLSIDLAELVFGDLIGTAAARHCLAPRLRFQYVAQRHLFLNPPRASGRVFVQA